MNRWFAGSVALPLFAAALLVLSGCGGSENVPQTGPVASEPVTTADLQQAPEPQPVATPDDIDAVYDEIFHALDEAYSDLGNPPSEYEQLSRVQDVAAKSLAGGSVAWPPGTSYSLSVLDDRVAVYINCDGEERKGDWVPGHDADHPI